jgi:hypothetical protein
MHHTLKLPRDVENYNFETFSLMKYVIMVLSKGLEMRSGETTARL